MEWWNVAQEYDSQTWAQSGSLELLPAEWQRELVALERAQRDMNNGGYLQFLVNCGRESYVYASRALKTIGAQRMADIFDRCQALVDEHFSTEGKSPEELLPLMTNEVLDPRGNVIKESGSVLPEVVHERISELSYAYISDVDGVYTLAEHYYRPLIEGKMRA